MKTKQEFDCEGTEHTVRYKGETKIRKCDGNGRIVLDWYLRKIQVPTEKEADRMIKDFETLGIPYVEALVRRCGIALDAEELKVPTVVRACPCLKKEDAKRRRDYIESKLGPYIDYNLTSEQKRILEAQEENRNIFIYGPSRKGKTVALRAIGMREEEKNIKIVTGLEINQLAVASAQKENRFWDWHGLLLIDDIDKMSLTEHAKRFLWQLFNETKTKKIDLAITSNVTPDEFIDMIEIDNKDSLQTRMADFCKFRAEAVYF